MSPEEMEAAHLIESTLERTPVPLDVPGAPDLTPDFEVVLAVGRRIVLEVTSTRDKAVLAVLATAFRKEWDGPGLVNDWHVSLPHPVGGAAIHVPTVMRRIVPLLAILEREGVQATIHVSRWPAGALAPGANRALIEATVKIAELDVLSVRPMGPPPDASRTARLFASIRAGFSPDIDKVNQLVTEAAKANVKKLAAAEAEFAVFQGQPPSAPPELPSGVDVVWVAAHGFVDIGKVGVTRFWRVQPPEGWEQLQPPDGAGK
jgi:hypothetical protein